MSKPRARAAGRARRGRRFWPAALAVATLLAPVAQAGKGLHFEKVGSESGPPSEVITALYQDRTGFIWIGARDRLTLFDGYTFTTFEHDPADPASISDNAIRAIYEDREGRLWIGTNTGGLNLLDRATWTFEHFRHDSANPRSLSHDSVYSILQDQEGKLWVGTQVGLNRFDPATGECERFHADPGNPTSLSNDYIITLFEDRHGRLWVGTLGGGLNVRDNETGAFVAYRHDPGNAATLSNDRVLAIAEDDEGRLWIGTSDGLNRFDPRHGSVRRFMPGDAPGSLPFPLVTSLVRGPDETLWVGTHGGGLSRIDTTTGEIHTWRHDMSRTDTLGSDEVVCLLADASGALWVGTWGGGLSRLTPRSMLLTSLSDLTASPGGLPGEDVTALLVASDGDLWLGSRTGDLLRWNPRRDSERHYFPRGTPGSRQTILGIEEGRDGRIWVATNGGLVRLDPATGETENIHHDPSDPTSLGPGYVRVVRRGHDNTFWVGTGEGGLQRIGRDGRVLERHLHDPADPSSLGDDYVTTVLETRDGTMWIGTRSGGLNELDPATNRWARHAPDPNDPTTVSHHYVTSMLEDSRGTLWVGTGGGGLNRVDRLADGRVRFQRISEAAGLADDDVMGLIEDDDGSLWISTQRGLSRYDPESGAIASFFVGDGLPSGEFEPGAVARDARAIYLGSVKGLATVPVGTPLPEPVPSPVVLTSIRTASGPVRGTRPVWELDELRVPWGEWLSLEFAVLDFGADRRHRYDYRLHGDQGGWIELGGRREITFTDLDPGDYEFSLRGRNSQGVWSASRQALHLRVIPPFWMTWWFRAVVFGAVVLAAAGWHRVRTSALEARNRELLELTEQRERAREELRRAYDRLRRLTRRLEAAKEDERKQIARELHDEMGPSLTAVIINLQLIASETDDEKKTRRTADTVELIDRMVQKIRDLSLDMRPPLLDELGLVPALTGYLETLSGRTGVPVEVRVDGEVDGLSPELEITAFRVVQESVTNVIRHADAERTEVTVRKTAADLELEVRDDGRGFDVRDTMERVASGKAVGLLGMQERVRGLGGDLEIRSEPGHGTEIRARLPLEVQP